MMNQLPIRNLVKRTEQCDPTKLGRDSIVYIDISSIDRETKRIVTPQVLPVGNAPSRARQRIHVDDVLVSTVRPNLNSVAFVPAQFDNEIASTGFCVLRARKEALAPRYLFYFTQSAMFVGRLTRLSIGAGYPAVTDDSVLDTLIPLPPLPEQQRIAAILERADRLRRLRRYALELSEGYLQAVFVEMFGDPVRNPKEWDWATVQDVSVKVTDGEHVTPQRTQTGIKLLSARNIQNGFIDFTTGLDYIPECEYQRIKKRCNPERGDILMSCSGTVGRVTTVDIDEPFSMVRSVALIKPDPAKVRAKYLEHYLRSDYSQRQIEQNANQSSQANIFNEPIRKLPVLVPPLGNQQLFTQIVYRYERLRAQQREAARQAEQLFGALLGQAFRGEL